MSKNAFIAITGAPNAGKSSLMNLLVGEKVSIVSEKPQTTRNRINGILTKGETQYVFIDTPGMHKARTKLAEHMVKTIKESVSDVDCAVLMADAAKKITRTEKGLLERFSKSGVEVILLLNKIDLIKNKNEILSLIKEYSELYEFAEIIPVSVKRKINTELILPALEKYAKEGDHFFPDDIATDRTERFMCSEIIREKILWTMRDEIPHGTAVEIESFNERANKKGEEIIDISAVIVCEKDSHKGMIIGKAGERLKKIATMAREDIEDLLGSKVNLQCFVKVRQDWRDNERFINELGIVD